MSTRIGIVARSVAQGMGLSIVLYNGLGDAVITSVIGVIPLSKPLTLCLGLLYFNYLSSSVPLGVAMRSSGRETRGDRRDDKFEVKSDGMEDGMTGGR